MCVMHPHFRICCFFAATSVFKALLSSTSSFGFAHIGLQVIVVAPCDEALDQSSEPLCKNNLMFVTVNHMCQCCENFPTKLQLELLAEAYNSDAVILVLGLFVFFFLCFQVVWLTGPLSEHDIPRTH